MPQQEELGYQHSETHYSQNGVSQGSVEQDVAPPDRTSSASAPPALQLQPDSLFAFTVEYAKIFSDIRAHEDYIKFYESNVDKNLPPPLEPHFLIDFYQNTVPNEEEDFESKRLYSNPERYSGNGIPHQNNAYQDQINEAQKQLQELHLANRGPGVELTGNEYVAPNFRGSRPANPTLWTPTARKAQPVEHFAPEDVYKQRFPQEQAHGAPRFMPEAPYSSSPNSQTAFNIANYVWRDEDQSSVHFPKPVPGYMNQAMPYPANAPVHTMEAPQHKAVDHFNSPSQLNGESAQQTPASVSQPDTPNKLNGENSEGHGAKSAVVCRYYAAGYCSRGEKCFYSHDLDAQQQTKSEANGTSKNRTPTKQKHGRNSQPAAPTSPQPSSGAQTPPATSSSPPPTTPSSDKIALSNQAINAAILSPRNQTTEPTYTSLEQLIGKIYLVSKDQQGCRFLQKKLEEQDAQATQIIFSEVFEYITELMTDPFGNYLCQKLLEHCTDDQRLAIVRRVAPDLVSISKNMHGTRAVQKMIECLSSPEQIELIKKALSNHVVELIQDLNGNHVIQRCLNRLPPEDNQFIYDAVTSGNNCVEVATHRHGCCVLQRCIDHASEKQKIQLIHEITNNALVLVQDPYGNYVVQYVLELPFPNLVEMLSRNFAGHIRQLATQKFSSNVVEKCLAVATQPTRQFMIAEILSENNLIQMLQDPFANYVVQTALAVSDSKQHQQLVESIKPHMTQLRNTPYGKRIQSKIAKESIERNGKHK